MEQHYPLPVAISTSTVLKEVQVERAEITTALANRQNQQANNKICVILIKNQ
jgi:hypothetical protein